jgi:AcrR family transcriptional regulator
MPKNRHTRPREEKISEIVAIAQRLFLERGYDGTTMAAIAGEAGVATNVVHWYFATKDELFVAALDSLQSDELEELLERRFVETIPGEETKALGRLLTEFVWRLLDVAGLIATVHERAHHSPVLAEFHDQAHRRYADYLGRAVARCDVPEAEPALVVEALLTAFEGLVMHHASRSKSERMMTFLVQRLTAAG